MSDLHRRSRLAPWQRMGVYYLAGLLTASGATWLILEDFVRVEGSFGPERLPLERLMLIFHGAAAYLFLPLAGLIAGTHAVRAWKLGQNRLTGTGLCLTLLTLSFTAVMLYYSGGDQVRSVSSLMHWTVGLSLPLVLLVHIISGRKQKPKARRPPSGSRWQSPPSPATDDPSGPPPSQRRGPP